MKTPVRISNMLRGGLGLGLLASTLSACGLTAPLFGADLPKLVVADSGVRVRGEVWRAGGTPEDLGNLVTAFTEQRVLGMYVVGPYVVTVNPTMVVSTTIPPDDAQKSDETRFTRDGATETRSVLKQPIFFLTKMKIAYSFPGYADIPVQELPLQRAMKEASQVIEDVPIGQAEPVLRAMFDRPAETPAAKGTVTVTIEAQDLDPLVAAASKVITLTHDYSVLYSAQGLLLGLATANLTPLFKPNPVEFPEVQDPAQPAAP